MLTLCGLKGDIPYIRNFIDKMGYTKYDGIIDVSPLETYKGKN